jgi:hypothetical protein
MGLQQQQQQQNYDQIGSRTQWVSSKIEIVDSFHAGKGAEEWSCPFTFN